MRHISCRRIWRDACLDSAARYHDCFLSYANGCNLKLVGWFIKHESERLHDVAYIGPHRMLSRSRAFYAEGGQERNRSSPAPSSPPRRLFILSRKSVFSRSSPSWSSNSFGEGYFSLGGGRRSRTKPVFCPARLPLRLLPTKVVSPSLARKLAGGIRSRRINNEALRSPCSSPSLASSSSSFACACKPPPLPPPDPCPSAMAAMLMGPI